MNIEHYTDNYGKIEPNINDYVMTTISTETNLNNNTDFNLRLNDLYNNNRYIIHELIYASDYHHYSVDCTKIFIDNYGNYYIYDLYRRGKNITLSNTINTDNNHKLSNKLIDFIKNIDDMTFSTRDCYIDIKFIDIFEKILINIQQMSK
jgi:hypothetical protein